jgi:hypothetical protein
MKPKLELFKPCDVCDHDPQDRMFEGKDMNLYKQRKHDRKLVNEYCEEEEMLHSNHKCKPLWKKCCGTLDHYLITLKDSKYGWPKYLK